MVEVVFLEGELEGTYLLVEARQRPVAAVEVEVLAELEGVVLEEHLDGLGRIRGDGCLVLVARLLPVGPFLVARAVGQSHLCEVDSRNLQLERQVGNVVLDLAVVVCQLLVLLFGGTDGQVAAQAQLHARLVVLVLALVDGLEEEVGLLVVECEVGEEEVELQFAVEGILVALLVGLYLQQEVECPGIVEVLLRNHVALEGDEVFGSGQRHVDIAFHASALDGVLLQFERDLLQAHGPSPCGAVHEVVESEAAGDAALVEDHVRSRNLEALVAILEEALGHLHGYLSDEEALPCVGTVLTGRQLVGILVLGGIEVVGGEGETLEVTSLGVVVPDVLSRECPSREVFRLEGIQADLSPPVFPVPHLCFDDRLGFLALNLLSLVVALDEVGQQHLGFQGE